MESVVLHLTIASENPVDHIVNVTRKGWTTDLFGIEGVWLWSAHTGNLVLAGLIVVLMLWYAAERIRTGPESLGARRYLPRSIGAHAIEVVCVYLRDKTVKPLLGARTERFMPFLWTVFFFILVNNLLGLAPITDFAHIIDHFAGGHYITGLVGATATQNLFVTGALALMAGLVINIAGIRELGPGGYLAHLTAGTKFPISLLLVPIEIVGTFIKPVALALRLFANMTAGHILVAVLFMFAVNGLSMLGAGFGKTVLGGTVSILSVTGAVAIYFLELFVAFLQAFVFMFLTTVFISQLSHHHDHEHEEAHGHEHAHSAA